MINTGRYIQLEASTEKVSYDSVRFIRVGHEIVVGFVLYHREASILQVFGHGFRRLPVRRARGRAMIFRPDDYERWLGDLF